ncbi:hypothetical protein TIFTF001_014619 [Ficus carica]|uniref:Uncharacterized protein n=1 Tax=Ficus carica TaxID=3494 RepID=A0AA88ARL2_FICCA|nr:hypothetical protein TIFTF001_014619 [Ficus carica]
MLTEIQRVSLRRCLREGNEYFIALSTSVSFAAKLLEREREWGRERERERERETFFCFPALAKWVLPLPVWFHNIRSVGWWIEQSNDKCDRNVSGGKQRDGFWSVSGS